VDLGDEIRHAVVRLHQGLELLAPARVDVKLGGDVGQPAQQGGRRRIAVNLRQSGIGVEIMAVRRGAENTFDRMLEKGAVARIARHQPLIGPLRKAVQRQDRGARCNQNDKARRELAVVDRGGGDADDCAQQKHRQHGGRRKAARHFRIRSPGPRQFEPSQLRRNHVARQNAVKFERPSYRTILNVGLRRACLLIVHRSP
jgi:hypothetical protein